MVVIRMAVCGGKSFWESSAVRVRAFNRGSQAPEQIVAESFPVGKDLPGGLGPWEALLLDGDSLDQAWQVRESLPGAVALLAVSRASMALLEAAPKLGALRCLPKNGPPALWEEAFAAVAEAVRQLRPRCLAVTHYHNVFRVPYGEIAYVHRVDRTTEIVLSEGPPLRDRRPLGEVFHALGDPRFFYIQRGCFVNLDHVRQAAGAALRLWDGTALPVGQAQFPALQALLTKTRGGEGT